MHLGSVQHLTRVTLGVLEFVLTVPDSVPHLLPPALVPAIPIPTPGPPVLNFPIA